MGGPLRRVDLSRLERAWRDLPLRRKGLVVVSIPVVPLLVMTLLLLAGYLREQRAAGDVERTFAIRAELDLIVTRLLDAESAAYAYLLDASSSHLDRFDSAAGLLPGHLANLDRWLTDDEVRARAVVLNREAGEALDVIRALMLARQAAAPGWGDLLSEQERRMAALRTHIDGMVEAEDALLAHRQERAAVAERITLTTALAGAALGVVGGIAAALLFGAGVSRRVDRARENAGRLAERMPLLPAVEGEDEVAQLDRQIREADALLAQRERDLQRRIGEVTALNKELEAFSYSVSHDLRAPLRHVAGFAALLQKSAGDRLDGKSLRYVHTIVDAAARMGQLVDDLLAFSRMGRTEMLRTEVDLEALLDDVIAEEMRGAEDRQVEWRREPLPRVKGDRAMLRVVLSNLISNALKYTRRCDRAVIEIGTGAGRDEEVVLFVRDNGVGFDMAYADKLFGVFQRLHRAEEFEGTGIGLANVGRIVHRHQGRVWAEGEVGRGATFYVALPADRAASTGEGEHRT